MLLGTLLTRQKALKNSFMLSSFPCLLKEYMSDLVWKRHCNLEVFGLNYCVTLNYEINVDNSNYKWCRVNDLDVGYTVLSFLVLRHVMRFVFSVK